MDYEGIRTLLQFVNLAGTVTVGAWLYIEKRNDKTNDRVSALSDKLDRLEKTVSIIESRSATHTDLSKIYDSLNTLAQTVHQMVGENRGQTDTLRLILSRITEKGMA